MKIINQMMKKNYLRLEIYKIFMEMKVMKKIIIIKIII